jgi:hypothetical protein
MRAWSSPLTKSIALKDGRVLCSLKDACDLLPGLIESRQGDDPWTRYAAELLLKAAETDDAKAIEEATVQMRRALVREGLI